MRRFVCNREDRMGCVWMFFVRQGRWIYLSIGDMDFCFGWQHGLRWTISGHIYSLVSRISTLRIINIAWSQHILKHSQSLDDGRKRGEVRSVAMWRATSTNHRLLRALSIWYSISTTSQADRRELRILGSDLVPNTPSSWKAVMVGDCRVMFKQ